MKTHLLKTCWPPLSWRWRCRRLPDQAEVGHVYETSEPYHTESVWAAEEIRNAPRQVRDPGLSGQLAGKETTSTRA